MNRLALVALFALLPAVAGAQAIRCKDPATGKILYTDQPCKGGELVVPQRFHVSGQAGAGDRHVYASRTRFIPRQLLEHFESAMWPLAAPESAGVDGVERPTVDLAARMRAMWR